MGSVAGKWGYSYDGGELFQGAYDSPQEAAEASGRGLVVVGQYRDPVQPEEFVEASDIIDHVLCQDEYCGDWADGVLDCSPEQKDELTAALRTTVGTWLDRHGLRPEFGMVDANTMRKIVVGGE